MAYGISRHAEVKIRNESKEANNPKMEKTRNTKGKTYPRQKTKGQNSKKWEPVGTEETCKQAKGYDKLAIQVERT